MALTTPQLRIERACAERGRDQVVQQCIALLHGDGDVDDVGFVVTLGGSHAAQLLANGVPAEQAYWLKVWAARGLLWAGPGDDPRSLRAALADGAWRVREMACKVVARHRIEDLLDDVVALERDPVARVRVAAARAVRRVLSRPGGG